MRTARSSATSITNADPGSRSITNVTTQSSHALVARITHSPQSIVIIPVAPRVVPLRNTIAGGCDTYHPALDDRCRCAGLPAQDRQQGVRAHGHGALELGSALHGRV